MRSRAYLVLLVAVAVLSVLLPSGSKNFAPTRTDAAIDTALWFVLGAAAWCVGEDVGAWIKKRRKARA